MRGSATNPTARGPIQGRPRTTQEFLDREEMLAIAGISESAQRLGEELLAASELRRRIRSRPFLSTGLAAVFGYLAGPRLRAPHALGRILARGSAPTGFAPTRHSGLPGLLLSSLRYARGRTKGR